MLVSMNISIETVHNDLVNVQNQLAVISNVLANEGKLTPWAIKALAEARKEHPSLRTSLKDL